MSHAFSGIAELLEQTRADGPMQDASLGFVLTLTSAIAEATIDAVIREPAEADAQPGGLRSDVARSRRQHREPGHRLTCHHERMESI